VSLGRQIRRYGIFVAAILAMMLAAVLIAGYILSNQRINWPWQQWYEVSGRFENSQAVLPGKGQAVTISGVRVGDISEVELEGGTAVITIRLKEEYGPVYRDAAMMLRPRTAAKDQEMALDPGTESAGAVPDGDMLPLSSTAPDVNTDEIFAILDGDTRNYVRLLVDSVGTGLDGRGRSLRRLFASSQPNAETFERISRQLAARRHQIARLVHNLDAVARATAENSDAVAGTIRHAADTLEPLARNDANLRSALSQLPGTLGAARAALADGELLAGELGPAARELGRPVRRLEPALRAIRPALAGGDDALRDELAPLVREAKPLARDLGPIARDLRAPAGDLVDEVEGTREFVNMLVNEPEGPTRSYLYYAAWFAHNGASFISGQDAHGSFWRGLALFSCSNLIDLFELVPSIGELLDAPDPSTLPTCPEAGKP
jgi:phospholipid/cholesterol/gamma-HCH transport system substrate-binding protein